MVVKLREDYSFEEIPLARPDISDKEIKGVLDVLQTPNLSLGPKLREFETKFANYIGVNHAIAVNSGTAGLHLAIKSLNIGDHDAVITTPFSFIASANCILFERATPIFVDIDESTLNIDPEKIAAYLDRHCFRNSDGAVIDRSSGKQVKAILPVHVFGLPCDMEQIMAIAHQYDLYVIEDACEAIGAEFIGQKAGTFGNLAVFAFYPNKQITTGEGGMIVTNDEYLARMCRSLRNQGRDDIGGWLAHHRLGYNYRISEINCVLGIAQLERIDEILAKRAEVAYLYSQRLKNFVNIPVDKPNIKRSWFTYVVTLDEKYAKSVRDEILIELSDKGIGCSNYFPPIHLQPFYMEMFGYKKGDFPTTESVSERTVALSFYNDLKSEQLDYIAHTLKATLINIDIAQYFEHIKMPVQSLEPEFSYAI